MRVGKIGIIVIGLVPFNVYGECTPTPDCASIGYTETSCEGASLKCPFDTSKMKCMPCDSSYRYDCSGNNITGGIGSACGGKYVNCECSSSDYVFNNGSCVCGLSSITDCLVGTIYYPNGKCSNEYVACLHPVGVVVKDNELVMGQISSSDMVWGTYGTDVDTLTNVTSQENAKADYNGKENTTLLVAFHTAKGLTASNSAAIYCNEYAPIGMDSSQGQWYLPAIGELYAYLNSNYHTIENTWYKIGVTISSSWFWSSSESSGKAAWPYSSSIGISGGSYDKNFTMSVVCFLAID